MTKRLLKVSISVAVVGLLISGLQVVRADAIPTSSTRGALLKIMYDGDISFFLARIGHAAIDKFQKEGLQKDGLGIALILDSDRSSGASSPPAMGGFNMDLSFYPASVIKLCYAAALEHDFAMGMLPRDSAVLQDLDQMITLSSNSATNRILDRLTGTQSGPKLSENELKEFAAKRQVVNTYLRKLGFRHINACQKTWDNAPFGRDTQFLGTEYENRNSMTPAETARLVWLIKNEKVASPAGCQEILKYMRRRPGNTKDIQARRIGSGIPPSSKFWSKAGWTDESNHDAAYVEMPMGRPFVLAVFTKTSWKQGKIITWIAQQVATAVQLGTIHWRAPTPGPVVGPGMVR